jgi:hypothetical protein
MFITLPLPTVFTTTAAEFFMHPDFHGLPNHFAMVYFHNKKELHKDSCFSP